jgi:hypothetical protein
MTPLAWTTAALGVAAAALTVAAIAGDVWLVKTGRPTISGRALALGRRYPVVPALAGAAIGLVVGALLGHLWFQQGP